MSKPVVEPGTIPRNLWLWALAAGIVLWCSVATAVALTDDTILAPNLILLGSFLVPICTVLFVLSRPREAHLTVEMIVLGFLAGGTAGVVLTGTTEVYVLPDRVGTNALIGVIEEGGKALILVAVALLVRPRVPRDGMVLGLTVGAGFAAFESAGYALTALIQHSDDHPVLHVLQTEAHRGVLAPFGHLTWTAILGGAIFASAWTTGRFRLDRRVVGTFIGVVVLHGLLGRVVRVGNPHQPRYRRLRLGPGLARYRRVGRDAERRRPVALPDRLRRPAGRDRVDRARVGDPPLARLPDRPLDRDPPTLGVRRARSSDADGWPVGPGWAVLVSVCPDVGIGLAPSERCSRRAAGAASSGARPSSSSSGPRSTRPSRRSPCCGSVVLAGSGRAASLTSSPSRLTRAAMRVSCGSTVASWRPPLAR